jgi:hypothetical protein
MKERIVLGTSFAQIDPREAEPSETITPSVLLDVIVGGGSTSLVISNDPNL